MTWEDGIIAVLYLVGMFFLLIAFMGGSLWITAIVLFAIVIALMFTAMIGDRYYGRRY